MVKDYLCRLKSVKLEDLVYYSVAILLGLFILSWYQYANDEVVSSLLLPHAKATEVYYNINLQYISGIGYTAHNAAFIIGKECMGVNFIVLMFNMLVFAFTKTFTRYTKPIWLIISFTGAVVIGIGISCIRIIGSVPFVTNEKFGLLHAGSGIALYFLVLLGIYFLIKKILGVSYHEKN